jgi:hypothetical protein
MKKGNGDGQKNGRRQIIHVEQTNANNCGAACLAMVLGLQNIIEAELILGRDCLQPMPLLRDGKPVTMGYSTEEMSLALFANRVPHYLWKAPENCPNWKQVCWEALHIPTIGDVYVMIKQGRPVILAVTSLNYEDSDHWIFVIGDTIWDPSPMKRYGGGEVLPIVEAILL